MKTHSTKPSDVTREWWIVDAEGVVLGRLASEVAKILRGKHKPIFAPHVDVGDHVIIINASKVVLTGNKLLAKQYFRHSGYPGGLRSVPYSKLMATRPDLAIEKAVKGMLPSEPTWPGHDQEAQGLLGFPASSLRATPQDDGSQRGRRSAGSGAGAHDRGGNRWLRC